MEEIKAILDQSKVDVLFGYKLNGIQIEDWMLQDLQYIQSHLKDTENINISIPEALYFWSWRSRLYDASFLAVSIDGRSDSEITDYFNQFVQEWYKD